MQPQAFQTRSKNVNDAKSYTKTLNRGSTSTAILSKVKLAAYIHSVFHGSGVRQEELYYQKINF